MVRAGFGTQQLAGIGHGDPHPPGHEKPADPRTVGSHLECDRAIRMVFTELSESGAITGDRKLFEDHSILVSDTDMVFPIAKVDSEIRFELLTRVFDF